MVALCLARAGFLYPRELGALVPRELDAGWMLLDLSKLPKGSLLPSLSNYTTSLGTSSKKQ